MVNHMTLLCLIILFLFGSYCGASIVKHYEFNVTMLNVNRLCSNKSIVTINGQFPGPEIHVNEGDRVLIKVNNLSPHNMSIHWHGVRQLRSGWYDGPAYITQCPIQPGSSFLYNFSVEGQIGTLWWHAHISWLRATVYGAFIIHPMEQLGFPFPKPNKEITLLLGEWWKDDVTTVIKQALASGSNPNVSDAYTINGLPGPFYTSCSQDGGTYIVDVVESQTYLLRLINAGLNNDMFFSIADHNLTIVEADATYIKPFTTNVVVIAPGQTLSILLKTNQPKGAYYIAASTYFSAHKISFDNTTTAAILRYSNSTLLPIISKLPAFNDTPHVTQFDHQLRKLNTSQNPISVPMEIDQHLFYTVGLAVKKCPKSKKCKGPNGGMMRAAFNNVSFVLPNESVLEAHYRKAHGVYTTDFPSKPLKFFNFTGAKLKNLNPNSGTMAKSIPFGAKVQLILQDTSIVTVESHPIHLHGYNMYVVGAGFGNYNSSAESTFNLVDPPERNTLRIPVGGWIAVRFIADNPGIWYMHCHFEVHASWGLDTLLLVQSGNNPLQKIDSPPLDLPRC